MKDDLVPSFSPGDRFTGVRMQQGEVQLDADWNESSSIAARQMLRDVVGTFDSVTDLAARADTLVRSTELGGIRGAPADAVFQFDPGAGTLRFGDGAGGEVPATGAAVESAYRRGAGGAGNVARVPPFPIELVDTGDDADTGIQLLEAWAAVAEKLTAYQEAVAREAHLPSAGGSGDAGEEGGDPDPVRGLTALLQDVRGLRESFAQRLERARSDAPPTEDDD